VVFVGAMGSGKTTIGSRVAAALERPFVDNDDALTRTAGMSAAELAARDGVGALHRAEAVTVLDALQRPEPSVIAAAASTITDPTIREALSNRAWVVWLRADADSLVARLAESAIRPLRDRDPARLVADQSRERDVLFADVAEMTVETGDARVDDVVTSVLASARRHGFRSSQPDQRGTR
jgi:shikimate kinase